MRSLTSNLTPGAPDGGRLPLERVRSDALLTLSTGDVRPQDSLDYWREMVLRLFADVQIAARVDDGFHGRMRSRLFDGMRMTVVDAASQAVERRHREAREAYEDCYFAVLMLSGSQRLEQDGRQVLLQPGDFAFYDGSRPHRLTFSRQWGEIILNIPRPQLERLLPGAGHCTAVRVGCGQGAGALLRSHLSTMAQEMGALAPGELSQLADPTLGLIATAMSGAVPVPPQRGRGVTLARAKALIERRLEDPQLDSAHIAAALGVSPRYLNRLFEAEHTSLMRHVWNRRLDRCREALRDPACAGRSIGEVALRWGFNDLSHFSRAFRARFGCSPREWRKGLPGG